MAHREGLELERRRRERHRPAARSHRGDARRRAPTSTPCATRRAAGWPRRWSRSRRAARLGIEVDEAAIPVRDAGARRLRAARPRSAAASPTKASCRVRPARRARSARSPRCARTRSGRHAARIGSVTADHPRRSSSSRDARVGGRPRLPRSAVRGAAAAHLSEATAQRMPETQQEPASTRSTSSGSPEGMSCDGDTVSITAAHPAEHRGRRARAHPRPAQGAPAQQGARLRDGGEDYLEPFRTAPRTASSAPVRARDRGLDPQREHQRRRLLDRVRQRPARPASRSRSTRGSTGSRRRRGRWSPPAPAPPTAASTRWPATRPAHGPGRLPRLGLPLEGGPADRQRAGLPGPARQLHGDARSGCSSRPPGRRR